MRRKSVDLPPTDSKAPGEETTSDGDQMAPDAEQSHSENDHSSYETSTSPRTRLSALQTGAKPPTGAGLVAQDLDVLP